MGRWDFPDHNDDDVVRALIRLLGFVGDYGSISACDLDVVIVEITGIDIAIFSKDAWCIIYKIILTIFVNCNIHNLAKLTSNHALQPALVHLDTDRA